MVYDDIIFYFVFLILNCFLSIVIIIIIMSRFIGWFCFGMFILDLVVEVKVFVDCLEM